MADRNALGVIGYILGAVTAAVMIIGVLVVSDNIANARDGGAVATSALQGVAAVH